jgi:gamma-glutamyl-gamma-aminobutyrate hydrolase PuuD
MTDMKIKIGVSAYFVYPDPNRTIFGHKMAACLENDLARYLARPGMMPILIPDLEPERLQELLRDMDGFVLQGGVDVSPETYGHKFLDREKWPGDAHRDHYELKILEFAIANDRPVLGICRGCQLINVFFGGTLYQDLGTEFGQKSVHRDTTLYDKVHHAIAFEPNGLLEKLYASELQRNPAPRVNSVHHQGIRELGKDLKVEAICPDDLLVEAVAYKDLRQKFVLGVQWHPEFSHTLKEQIIPPEPLYNYFIDEVVRRKKA